MSSSGSGPPIHLELRPSRRLVVALCLLHGAALVAVTLAAIPWLISAAGGGAILLAFHRNLRLYAFLDHPRAVVSLVWTADGVHRLRLAGGESIAVRRLDGGVVWSWLVVLPFRLDRRRFAVLALPDNTRPDAFRRLRARLRFP
ncbi:MAG: protein YgfX [Pseudomonadota bacterium]